MNHLISITGAGPGDPELLTIKAHQRLSVADAVLYDALPGDAILKLAPAKALLIYAGKLANDGQSQELRQEIINQTMLELAREGKRVVRLKGGDPMVFGRGAEEIRFCKQHSLNYEVIPGVTAALAASGEFEIPLTERRRSSMVLLYTATRTNGQFSNLDCVVQVLKSSSTVSVYMGLKNLAHFADALIEAGIAPGTPVNILSNISHPDSSILSGNLGNIGLITEVISPAAPAVVIIGEYATPVVVDQSKIPLRGFSANLLIEKHRGWSG